MRTVEQLTKPELVRIVGRVQQVLWLNQDGDGTFWNPDKEWDAETIEHVADALIDFNLRPKNIASYPTPRR